MSHEDRNVHTSLKQIKKFLSPSTVCSRSEITLGIHSEILDETNE